MSVVLGRSFPRKPAMWRKAPAIEKVVPHLTATSQSYEKNLSLSLFV